MTIHKLDPLRDPRWPSLISRHPEASVFHTVGWLQALQRTYGYLPVAYTTSEGSELSDAVLLCEVRSWLTGTRLVSLPFSDHCQPLGDASEVNAILGHLAGLRRRQGWKYIELRPLSNKVLNEAEGSWGESERFALHTIDLRPEASAIYRGFHDSCVRRKVKRAERENLIYESGRSSELLRKFRHLLLLTRRRHKLPPQPAQWFENIAATLGENMTIHCVSNAEAPVASIMTLSHKKVVVYKYGCSDSRFSNLGGTPLLFWKVIQQAKEAGMEDFDLGRSGYEDPGLIAFKGHLGAVATDLCYHRDPAPLPKKHTEKEAKPSWVREALARLPDPLLSGTGELLYRHMG